MDQDYWLERWKNKETGFHNKKPHPLLVKHFKKLAIEKNTTVFAPLCGKSLDLVWIASQGHQVIGVEFSQSAVEQFFEELNAHPEISTVDEFQRYYSKGIEIFVGDFFNTSTKHLGKIAAVYDRAALVALPTDLRKQYTTHLKNITNKAPQLLLCYKYDSELMTGPPFIVSPEEVKSHYETSHQISKLETVTTNNIRGKIPAEEMIYLLTERKK